MLEHRFAQLAALATFVLLLIGGTVNPTGSSLACPEPTLLCNGELFPHLTGGVLYEHGHRLAAMTVGFLQIALTFLLLRRRRELARIAWVSLAMVCIQGGLGAITVAFKLVPAVSTAHLALALAYFASLVYIGFRTRPAPKSSALGSGAAASHSSGAGTGTLAVRPLVIIGAALVGAQILLGGLVRHLGATLSCLDIPLCEGKFIPEAGLQKLQMAHRGLGIVVGAATIYLAVRIWRGAKGRKVVQQLAVASVALVLLQVALGFATVVTLREVPVAVAHFGGAAALWCTWISLWWATADVRRAPLRLVVESGVGSSAVPTGVPQ